MNEESKRCYGRINVTLNLFDIAEATKRVDILYSKIFDHYLTLKNAEKYRAKRRLERLAELGQRLAWKNLLNKFQEEK